MNENDAIRVRMIEKRQALSKAYQKSASHLICLRLERLEAYQKATHIAFYAAIHGEVDLQPLWELALQGQKKCYLPIIQDDTTLLFGEFTKDSPLIKNAYGIPEPKDAPIIPTEALDLILIPLVAFDASANRIGMGKGYYDRTLAHTKKPILVGVAYDFQQEPSLIKKPWDIAPQMIITNRS